MMKYRFKIFQTFKSEVSQLHLSLRILNLILFFMPHFCFNRLRTAFYRMYGIPIGKGTLILGSIDINWDGRLNQKLKIGENCLITCPLYLDANAEIIIGDHVAIGHHTIIITTDHAYNSTGRRCGISLCRQIVVEDGSWIGARATILPGVTIGKGSVVAAGSVVTKDVAPNTLVGGTPARIIRNLEKCPDAIDFM